MTEPLPQGSELARRAREVQTKLQAAQQFEAESRERLRSFATKALPSTQYFGLEADQQYLGPALPDTMAQCITELTSLHPAKQFTEALMVGASPFSL